MSKGFKFVAIAAISMIGLGNDLMAMRRGAGLYDSINPTPENPTGALTTSGERARTIARALPGGVGRLALAGARGAGKLTSAGALMAGNVALDGVVAAPGFVRNVARAIYRLPEQLRSGYQALVVRAALAYANSKGFQAYPRRSEQRGSGMPRGAARVAGEITDGTEDFVDSSDDVVVLGDEAEGDTASQGYPTRGARVLAAVRTAGGALASGASAAVTGAGYVAGGFCRAASCACASVPQLRWSAAAVAEAQPEVLVEYPLSPADLRFFDAKTVGSFKELIDRANLFLAFREGQEATLLNRYVAAFVESLGGYAENAKFNCVTASFCSGIRFLMLLEEINSEGIKTDMVQFVRSNYQRWTDQIMNSLRIQGAFYNAHKIFMTIKEECKLEQVRLGVERVGAALARPLNPQADPAQKANIEAELVAIEAAGNVGAVD